MFSLAGRDDAVLDGAPLGLVALEQARPTPALQDGGELPAEVDGVADPGVEPVPAERRVEVRGVPGEEHPAHARPVHELHARRPRVGGEHLGADGRAHRRVDQRRAVALAGRAVDAERDDPPGAGARIERAEQRGRVRR